MLVIFEFLDLTRACAVAHLCDCGVVRRLTVLGAEQLRAGARAFLVMGVLGVMLGGRVCDVVL